MTDENSTAQHTSLLVVFGMMFTSVGLSIGTVGSYGVLSWTFLGLGMLLPFIAVVLAFRGNEALDEQEQSA